MKGCRRRLVCFTALYLRAFWRARRWGKGMEGWREENRFSVSHVRISVWEIDPSAVRLSGNTR